MTAILTTLNVLSQYWQVGLYQLIVRYSFSFHHEMTSNCHRAFRDEGTKSCREWNYAVTFDLHLTSILPIKPALVFTCLGHYTVYSRFQTFAVIWILYMFFWVFPRCQIVVGRRFGTLYQFHLQRLDVDSLHPAFEDGTDTRFWNVGQLQFDAGEIPTRTYTTLHSVG